MFIEESFDTIFNMGYGSGKSPMAARVKINWRDKVGGKRAIYIWIVALYR